ncbi:hypothetical protein ACSLNR_28315, partial [Escherichia coli]|uniref:hypothetical protein n=1 Tax=Escherichia coli TaxID=562 RepID=UPI003EE29426
IDNEAGLTEQERKLLHVLATAEKNDLQAQESERKQAVQKRIEEAPGNRNTDGGTYASGFGDVSRSYLSSLSACNILSFL